MLRRGKTLAFVAVLAAAGLATLFWCGNDEFPRPPSVTRSLEVGDVLDSHRGVEIHYNGTKFEQGHGSRYSEEGYYYGKRWQCVEYVKRFYFDAKGHRMPNVWGHARDFFNPAVGDGALNSDRGLVQFSNGGKTAPAVDDLVVFRGGSYGHVAIVSAVGEGFVELVQQNVGRSARVRWGLEGDPSGAFRIVGKRPPAGWLRLPLVEL